MKLIGYLLKKIFPLFFGALFFFALVLNLVDLFMNIATYLQNNCTVKDIFTVMLNYVPKTVWYAVPVAILFSTSYTLSNMYATNELEALFASGVSLLHFCMPILIISFILSFGLFVFEDRVVVRTYERKVELQNQLLKKSQNENNSDVIVFSNNGTVVYKANSYNEELKKLSKLYLVFRDEAKKFKALVYSDEAFWSEEDKLWNLGNSYQYKLVDGDIKYRGFVDKEFTEQLTESYEIFRKSIVDIQSVNTKDAKVYINHLRKAGLPYQEQLSEYYKKYSFPFIVFLVVFVSIGLTGKTKKNVLLVSLASCIGASVLFYVMMMVTMVLAKHGYISPFMGAWFPVFFFMISSLILLKYSRT
jgi:lipopolysaccharide export system permease protein